MAKPISFLSRFIYVFLIILVMLSCGKKKNKITAQQQAPRPQAIRVDAFIVSPRTISEGIEVPGTLLANEITQIFPEVSGRVVQININEGQYVRKGTMLVKLFDGDLQAQLRKLEVQLKIAQQTESRQAQLLKIQGISQQDYDLSLLSVNNINADIEIIKANISKTVILAPYNGRLGLKNISPGAFVSPQTNITTITQTEQLKLDFTVPEKYTDRIKVGQIVNFNVQGKNKSYGARVMATEVSIAQTSRSLVVRANVQNKNSELLPGTFASVSLKFEPDPNALMIPSEAILPQARGKKVVTFNGGDARFIDVETGVRDSAFVQVVEGIRPGDTIITSGLLSIRPGSRIQISKITN